MRVAYVSGPYIGPTIKDTLANIMDAREIAVALWQMGYAVICPHSNTALMDGNLSSDPKQDRRGWLDGDLEILRRLVAGDVVVMGGRWQVSEGAIEERRLALSRYGVLVFEWPRQRGELEDHAMGVYDG